MYRDKELQKVDREGSLKSCCLGRTFSFFFKLWVYLFIYDCIGSSFLCEDFL